MSKHTRKQIKCRVCGDQPEPGTQCPQCLVIGVHPESQELQRIIWLLVQEGFGGRVTLDLRKIPLDWQLDRSFPLDPDQPITPGTFLCLTASLVKGSLQSPNQVKTD